MEKVRNINGHKTESTEMETAQIINLHQLSEMSAVLKTKFRSLNLIVIHTDIVNL